MEENEEKKAKINEEVLDVSNMDPPLTKLGSLGGFRSPHTEIESPEDFEMKDKMERLEVEEKGELEDDEMDVSKCEEREDEMEDNLVISEEGSDEKEKTEHEEKVTLTEREYQNKEGDELNSDREEGELEEGELEDEEETEESNKKEKQEEDVNEKEQNKENRENIQERNKEPNKEKLQTKEKKGKDERKRKHKEFDEERRKKKKKKHYSSDDEDTQKKKFSSGRENKPYDFDTLLKQEMYLVGSSNAEVAFSSEATGIHPSSMGYKEGESYESGGSEEDWEEKPRRRNKRKRRGSRSPSRKNEAICMFYLQGSCKRGSDCPYSHEIAPTRKMELCKFYMMDCCAKKEKCLYMHRDFPCKYYHFGMKCKAGELCKFSHDSLQEITRNILLKHIELAPKDILGDFPRVSKHNAQIIINVTETKRKGETVDTDNLEPLLDLEGKGFKYLDRALKNVRKKKDGEKKGDKEKEREREDKEKSPKKNRNRDDYRETDKDKEREKDKEKEKDKDRDRDRRDRDRNRDKRRHKPKGDYSASSSSFQKHRESSRGPHNPEDMRDHEAYGRGFDVPSSSPGLLNHPAEHGTQWYSSDEEGDNNNTQRFRRSQSHISPQGHRHRSIEGLQGSSQQNQFPPQQNLPDIDVMYLKNVLNAVQNQSSQIQKQQNFNTQEDEESRNNDMWDSRSSKYSSRDIRAPLHNYMDISNDIKEVFYDPPEPKENSRSNDFATSINSLIQRARERSSSGQGDYKDDYRDRNFKYQGQIETSWNQGNSLRSREGREDNSMGIQHNYGGNNDRNYPNDGGGRYSREQSWEMKRDNMDRNDTNGLSYGSKSNLDFQETGGSTKSDTDLRILTGVSRSSNDFNSDRNNSGDRISSSIYDFDFRQSESINIPTELEDDINALPFKVPMHSSAKEINACFNAHSAIFYQLIKVDIPKPDFSRLKIKPEDPKSLDDPRLRKMLRRNSSESPRSPKSKYEGADIGGSPTLESKESRDPRKISSRDPRTECKGTSRMDVRIDPRMANRPDPRSGNSRTDPRMDNRDPRMDPRDSLMDSDMRHSDPRIGGPVFVNGMMEGTNYHHFPNMGGMSNSIVPQGIDPRGRPGLLGPAPGQGPKSVPMGLHGQINQGIGTNPFLLPQSSYMPGDRGDMIGGSNSFQQGQWSSGRMAYNDPRNRDVDMGSFTSSSVS